MYLYKTFIMVVFTATRTQVDAVSSSVRDCWAVTISPVPSDAEALARIIPVKKA